MFKTSLVYRASSRTDMAIQGNPVSKTKKTRGREKEKGKKEGRKERRKEGTRKEVMIERRKEGMREVRNEKEVTK